MPAEIISRPDIHDGEPIIAGTRITVFAVKGFATAGYTVRQIMREYPDLTPEQIDAAIAYQPEPTMPADSRDMVLVPRELDDGMLAAAEQASQMLEWQIRAAWQAALSASPVGEGASASPIPTEQAGGPVVERLLAVHRLAMAALERRDDGLPYSFARIELGNSAELISSAVIEAAVELEKARLLREAIEELRKSEGATVTILCDNPEAASASVQCAIDVNDHWTDWTDRRFYGRDVAECLQNAVGAKAAPSTTSTAEQAGEGDAPVAWRFMLDGGWQYSAIDPRPHISGTVQPLYTHPTPATPEGLREALTDLHTIAGWLDGLASCPDLNDVAADGGVTVGMCYQQEAREFAGRFRRVLAALAREARDLPPEHVASDRGDPGVNEKDTTAHSKAEQDGRGEDTPCRSPVFSAAYDSIRKSAPGLSDRICEAIARSIAIKVRHAAKEATPEGLREKVMQAVLLGGDAWAITDAILSALQPQAEGE